jgi:hypothetical protein
VTAAVFCALTASPTASNVVQNADAVTRLEAGRTIEREISGAQPHLYQLALAAGDYASVTVEQRGIDVAVRLLGADGSVVVQFQDEIRNHGPPVTSRRSFPKRPCSRESRPASPRSPT